MLPEIWRNRGSLLGPNMDDFIERFFYRWPLLDRETETIWSPRVDVHETEKVINIDVELPGIEKKDIKIETRNNTLTISGERKYERDVKEGDTSRFERHYGKFERTFGLPESVETEKIAAEYKNGVLTVTLPKTAKALPKQVAIEVK